MYTQRTLCTQGMRGIHGYTGYTWYTWVHKVYRVYLDTMIFPILSYNSEIWGMYTKQDFKTWDRSPIEKIHLKFCKRYLEVNSKASNIACRAELGRLPLIIPINQRIMKYLVYLNNKDNDSFVKQSFLMSKNLHSINNSGFYSNFTNLIEHYVQSSQFRPGILR